MKYEVLYRDAQTVWAVKSCSGRVSEISGDAFDGELRRLNEVCVRENRMPVKCFAVMPESNVLYLVFAKAVTVAERPIA